MSFLFEWSFTYYLWAVIVVFNWNHRGGKGGEGDMPAPAKETPKLKEYPESKTVSIGLRVKVHGFTPSL